MRLNLLSMRLLGLIVAAIGLAATSAAYAQDGPASREQIYSLLRQLEQAQNADACTQYTQIAATLTQQIDDLVFFRDVNEPWLDTARTRLRELKDGGCPHGGSGVRPIDERIVASQQRAMQEAELYLNSFARAQRIGDCASFAYFDESFLRRVNPLASQLSPEWVAGFRQRYNDIKSRGCAQNPAGVRSSNDIGLLLARAEQQRRAGDCVGFQVSLKMARDIAGALSTGNAARAEIDAVASLTCRPGDVVDGGPQAAAPLRPEDQTRLSELDAEAFDRNYPELAAAERENSAAPREEILDEIDTPLQRDLLVETPDAPDSSVAVCPLEMGDQQSLVCRCNGPGVGGTVWGTYYYTTDSMLCRAAMHAGAIPASGGIVRAHIEPGHDYYVASNQNGFESVATGRQLAAVVFDDAPPSKEQALGSYALCPYDYEDDPAGLAARQGVCRCLKTDVAGGVVGSGVYASSSDVCSAAIHAGAIAEGEGGLVTIQGAPGQDEYEGSAANGVRSQRGDRSEASFVVRPGPMPLPTVRSPEKTPASATTPWQTIDWTDLATKFQDQLSAGSDIGIVCPPAPAETVSDRSGSYVRRGAATASRYHVYGSAAYGYYSHICAAALHAGLISWDGGRFAISPTHQLGDPDSPVDVAPRDLRPGLVSIRGSTSNGFTSRDDRVDRRTLFKVVASPGVSAAAFAVPQPPPTPAAQPGDHRIDWSTTYGDVDRLQRVGILWCPAAPERMRPKPKQYDHRGYEVLPDFTVSGMPGLYDTGNGICLAAVHRGIIGFEGGRVRVTESKYSDADSYREWYEDHGVVATPRSLNGQTFDVVRP